MGLSCMTMALSDFYATHSSYKTRLVLYTRDSNRYVVDAASAAIDLLKNVEVQAVVGPITSSQADFMADLGNKAQVPIISFSATSPSISPSQSPYFIRTAQNDSSHVNAIASIVNAFGWRSVVLIYEETEYGNGVIPYLIDAFQEIDTRVRYRSVISTTATDDKIFKELYKHMTMQTRVFILHMSPTLGSRLFRKAKEVGMMSKGYSWIITDGLTNFLNLRNSSTIDSMQGVLGVRPYVPRSNELEKFRVRWKRKFIQENPDMIDRAELNVFRLWAYDTIWALASAVEKIGIKSNSSFLKPESMDNSTSGISNLGVSEIGPKLLKEVSNIELKGLSGEFRLVDGQLQSLAFQIVNVIGNGDREIGFWTPKNGILRGLSGVDTSIDVFNTVMKMLPYAEPYDFIPFARDVDSYGDLIYEVYLKNYDAAVVDLTIIANRSLYVDCTFPYTESGYTMIVPFRDDGRKNGWIFLKPLHLDLWLTSGVFFVFTGLHRINEDFRGPHSHQLGTTFYFVFSTLVFAHKEKVVSNLARFVVIIWVFIVLILTSSYTANLTSMLTVQRLEPTVRDVQELIKNKENVGYAGGSFDLGLLKQLMVDESQLRVYRSPEDVDDALMKGTQKGGIATAFDEIPYIQLFLAKYSAKYTMVGPTYKNGGFAFAKRISSSTRAILNVTEGNRMATIEKFWFGDLRSCPENTTIVFSNSLTLNSFSGLFLIAAISSILALLVFSTTFIYNHKHIWSSSNPNSTSIWKRIVLLARHFDQKDLSSHTFRKSTGIFDLTRGNIDDISVHVLVSPNIMSTNPQSTPWSNSNRAEGDFSPVEDQSLSNVNVDNSSQEISTMEDPVPSSC